VDSLIREEGNPGGLWHFYREEAEKDAAFREHRTVHLRAPIGVSHIYGRDGTIYPIGHDGTLWLSEEDAGPAYQAGFVRLSE
jgi:hypothetical protein